MSKEHSSTLTSCLKFPGMPVHPVSHRQQNYHMCLRSSAKHPKTVGFCATTYSAKP